MPLVVKDRVMETTSSTGTGTITLGGAVAGFQSFSVIGNGNTTYYTIVGGTEWEVGIGTYTASGTTLSRDTVLESSNSGSLVNFSAGTKNVFVTYPAEESVDQDTAQTLSNKTLASPIVSSNLTFTGTGNRITGDFSNATASNRPIIQSSTTNGATYVFSMPNGTGVISGFYSANNSDVNNSSYMAIRSNATEASLISSYAGTGSYLPMTFYTGGLERMRVDASGNVGIGTTSPTVPLTIGGSTLPSGVTISGQMISSETNTSDPILSARVCAASGNPVIAQFTASGTIASPTAVVNNRGLGRNNWYGFDGANYINAASIIVSVDGTPSTNSMPARIVFATTSSGSSTPTERMRIDSFGNITVAKAVRGTITTDNDLSFDMNAASNFTCTPTANGTLTFTNITAGQSGYVLLVNTGGYVITAAATTKVNSTFLSTVSTAGTYLLSYFSNGTNVYVTTAGAMA